MDDRWFRRFHQGSGNFARLVCFPHAGGAASYYADFSSEFTSSIEVWAVQYPGRQERRREAHFITMQDLACQIANAICDLTNQPVAFFGHSMGAIAAFEVARRLEHEIGKPPVALFVSGRRAPSTYRDEQVHKGDDNGLLAELRALNGTDSRLLHDEEILQMVLPTLRADYRAIEAYRYEPGLLISCPVVAFAGDRDPKTTLEEARAWARHTTGPFDMHVLDGAHFFLNDHCADVAHIVEDTLRRSSSIGSALPR